MKIKRLLLNLKNIIIGPGYSRPQHFNPALRSLLFELKKVWLDSSFGVLRLLKIFLVLIQFFNPFHWFCHFADLLGPVCGKLFADIYVCGKLIFPLLLLTHSFAPKPWMNIVCFCVVIETLLYLYGIVFLTGRSDRPASYTRSFLLLLINYIAVTLSFAWIYYSLSIISGVDTVTESVYFSAVTSLTVGFGDMVPEDPEGYRLVIFQLFSTTSFLIVFFSYFLSKIGLPGESEK